ncbi:MAG: DUF5317 domain-containing protein [Actinomycetota bacterium]|nr:DUF5317 domain-containing protein [Actinomycetota bacterium]
MFLLVVLLVALVVAALRGGQISALSGVRFRHAWLALAAIGIQVLIISIIPDRLPWMHEPMHLVSYLAAVAFVWINRRIPGVVVIGLGGLLNLTAIALNGGVMPAKAEALRSAGIVQEAGEFLNSTDLADPRVLFLGDIFAIPERIPLLNNVFSVGDVVIALGTTMFILGVCGRRGRCDVSLSGRGWAPIGETAGKRASQ